MTTNHIDQLTQWWENAEEGTPHEGDTVIFDERHRGLGFHVTQATKDHPRGYDNARILARAPKPKPAWHDAVAVVAHVDDFRGAQRRVFVRRTADFGGICWEDEFSEWPSDELIEPVPLIEAKVTDEMRDRAIAAYEDDHGSFAARIDATLTAALGIEAE